jgi:hypothetical protein
MKNAEGGGIAVRIIAVAAAGGGRYHYAHE